MAISRLGARIRSLTLRQQLLGLFAAVVVGLLGIIVWEATLGTSARRAAESEAADHLRLRVALRVLQRHYGYDLGVVWTQHVAVGRLSAERAHAELVGGRGEIAAEWQQLAELGARLLPTAQQLLAETQDLRGPADDAVARLERILVAQDQAELMNFFALELDPATSLLLTRFEDLFGLLNEREAQQLARMQGRLWRQQLTSYGIALGVCAVLFLVILPALREIYRGIEGLTAVARRVTARDFKARPERIPQGELGELARAFVTMQEALALHEHELRERELEALAGTHAKSLFLAAMSHEIRTPLIGVLGMLEVLGRTRLDAEQRRQFNIVQQSAHSLLEIVGDILDYSKIEAGKVELEPDAVSIRDLVSRVAATFSANVSSKGLKLVQVVHDDVAPAHVVDGVRLMQILRNFLSNAIKFTEQGTITVSVHATGTDPQRLSFRVIDTGIGMDPGQLARLFQPFTQVDAGTMRRFGGTGLGLVICKRLAELMGGTVSAESTRGLGTTMTLELELPACAAPRVASAAAAAEGPVVTRARPERAQAEAEGSLLLLAEDHPVNRLVLTQQLDLAGFVVDTADDGTHALQKFTERRYGAVLTDLHMPRMDGYQLTAAIREFEQANGRPRTPVIALTANVMRGDVERCFVEGMDDYVAKPVTIRGLVQTLRRWLPDIPWEPAASAPPPEANDLPVDRAVLAEVSSDDRSVADQLLQIYCKTTTGDLAALGDALRAGDASAASLAHRIKGAALMVGASQVAQIAQRLEKDLRASRAPADAAAQLDALRQAFARVETYVNGVK